MNYGTYKGIDYGTTGDPHSKYEITIVLKLDGTYTQTNIITEAGIKEKYSGKYSISNQNSKTYIVLGANDTMYQVTANNQLTAVMSGSGEKITYVGN